VRVRSAQRRPQASPRPRRGKHHYQLNNAQTLTHHAEPSPTPTGVSMPSRTTMAQLLHVAIVVALAGVDATAAVHTRADAHTGAHDEVFPPAAAPAGPAITMPSQMDYWRRNANDKHAIAKPFYALHERGNSTILDAPTCAGNGASCNPATGRGTPCCAGLTCLPFSASCGTGSAMAPNAVVVEQHDRDAIALKIE
jgi:hypothetical protein